MSDSAGGGPEENEDSDGPTAPESPQPGPAGAPPQQGYQADPTVGDILNIPETKTELKIGIVLAVLVSIGLSIATLGMTTISGSIGGQAVGLAGAVGATFGGGVVLAPLLAVVLGLRQSDILTEQPETLIYANAALTGFLGAFVLLVLSLLLGLLVVGSGGFGGLLGQLLVPYFITAIGAGLVAAGAAWTDINVVPGPTRARQPQEQGQPR